jgi:hypothetical protein
MEVTLAKFDYDQLRFEAEIELVHVLEDDFALSNYYDIFDNKDELENITNYLLSHSVKLNRVIAPRLYDICKEVSDLLDFHEGIDFYLQASPEVNAFSINGFNIVPHMICFTSALINLLGDDELRFVIGHEIGHLIYKHSQLDVVNKILANRENEEIPAFISLNFLRWQRFAESTSDRIGYLAMPDIKTIGKSFFKFAAGVSEEHLNFDVDEYLKQLDQIREIAMGDQVSSHPNHLVRIRNLQLFSQSQIYPFQTSSNALSKADLLKENIELLNLLEIHPKKEKDKKTVELISTAGFYLAQAVGEVGEKEWKLLFEWLASYTTQPEVYMNFHDLDDLKKRTQEICTYFSNLHDGEKFIIFERLIPIALLDGRLEATEKARIYEIGKMLDISEEEVTQSIRRASEEFLTPSKRIMINKLL